MSNSCENNIKIHATTPNELVKFVRKYFLKHGGTKGELTLNFNKIIKKPRTESGHKYWGTGRNVDSDDVFFSINSIDNILTNNISDLYISCFTAWNPCIPIVLELQKYNPNIKVESTYYECGMCFAGEVHSDGSDIDIPFAPMNDDFRKWAIKEGYECADYYKDLDTSEGIIHDDDYYKELENYE